eukprot:5934573-Pleurochrysis_carterae.AAC.1
MCLFTPLPLSFALSLPSLSPLRLSLVSASVARSLSVGLSASASVAGPSASRPQPISASFAVRSKAPSSSALRCLAVRPT